MIVCPKEDASKGDRARAREKRWVMQRGRWIDGVMMTTTVRCGQQQILPEKAMRCSEWLREKQPQTFSAFSGHGASGGTTESYVGAG